MTKGVLLAIVGLFLLGTVGTGYYFVFGTAQEEVRHRIYKRSTAHIEGTIRTIERYQIQYIQAKGDDEKSAIASFVLREAQNIRASDLPADLATFVTTLKTNAKSTTSKGTLQ